MTKRLCDRTGHDARSFLRPRLGQQQAGRQQARRAQEGPLGEVRRQSGIGNQPEPISAPGQISISIGKPHKGEIPALRLAPDRSKLGWANYMLRPNDYQRKRQPAQYLEVYC